MTQFADLMAQAKNDKIEKIGVGAFICDPSGRLLVLQRAETQFLGNMWEIPTGAVEGGEAWELSLCRVVLEATHLEISHIGDYVNCFDYRSGSGRLTREHHFTVGVSDYSRLRLMREHKASAWISNVKQLGVLLTPEMRAAVSGFLGIG